MAVLAVSALLVMGLVWLTGGSTSSAPELVQGEDGQVLPFSGPYADEEKVSVTNNPMDTSNATNPVVVFTTSEGVFEVELFSDMMPITTGNFLSLVQDGFYNDTKFHRVIEGFMIQAGDPNTKSDDVDTYGSGSPGYTIQDEFVEGELLTNTPGTIAMANTGQPNSGGSQFFINVGNNTFLDFNKEPLTSKHPVFGRVISGMEVVRAIEQVETGQRDVPTSPIVIESVTVKE